MKIGIILSGSISNALLIIPSLRNLKSNNNEVIILYEKKEQYDLLKKNPFVDSFFSIYDSKAYILFTSSDKIYDFLHMNRHLGLLHKIDQIGLHLDCNLTNKTIDFKYDRDEENKVVKFLSKIMFPVIIQPASNDKRKEWNHSKWERLIDNFPNFTFIQVGKKNDQYISGTIDLRGKTTITGALTLIKHSRLCIGIDSFINHASAVTQTKAIILFGATDIYSNGYESNINVCKFLKCSPCSGIYHDAKAKNCEYDCMNGITVEEVSNCIKHFISSSQKIIVEKKKIGIISMEGIGDAIISTPIFRAIKEKFPSSEITFFCQDRLNCQQILLNNPNINKIVEIQTNFKNRRFFLKNYYLFDAIYKLFWLVAPNISVIEYLFKQCNLSYQKNIKLEIFLSNEEEEKAKLFLKVFKNPIAIQTKSSKFMKDWPISKWESLVRRNKNYTFIHLGDNSAHNIKGTVDMRGKTTIREAIAIIKFSKLFIGIDSFMAHACAAVNTPGIVLFGPTSKVDLGHSSNINISKNICIPPCYDFKCTLNKKCMNDIDVQDIENEIKNILQVG